MPLERQEAAVAGALASSVEAASMSSAPPITHDSNDGGDRRRRPDHHHLHAHPPDQPPRSVGAMFDRLVGGIIRPPRMVYEARALGPSPLVLPQHGLVAVRTDFEVVNARGQRLQCSLWEAVGPSQSTATEADAGWPCVMYLHGNSSSRIEAVKTNVLAAALAGGAQGVAAFDFGGCGLSEGEYVSLGLLEAEDCAAVMGELRRRHGVGPVVLWGRSMGAVTALLYSLTMCGQPRSSSSSTAEDDEGAGGWRRRRRKRYGRHHHHHRGINSTPADPLPAGLILDSPFSSFKQLAKDLTTRGMVRVPRIAVAAVMGLLRRSVRHRANFDLYDVKPLCYADRAGEAQHDVPALFLVAEQDELIPPWHAENLEASWPGPNKLGIRFTGTHNSPRPPIVYALASVFIRGAALSKELPLSVPAALRLVERTAEAASHDEMVEEKEQEDGAEVEEEGEGGEAGSRRREKRRRRRREQLRRRRERQRPSPFRYGDHHGAGTPGMADGDRDRKKGKRLQTRPPPAPRFVRAGAGGSMCSLPSATRSLVEALDTSLAARAVEEMVLAELLGVGVALVAAELRRAAAAGTQGGDGEAVAGDTVVRPAISPPPSVAQQQALLQSEVVRAQRMAAIDMLSSGPPVLRRIAGQEMATAAAMSGGKTPWDGVLRAGEPGVEGTLRALVGLRAAQQEQQHMETVEASPPRKLRPASVVPMPPATAALPASPVVASVVGRRLCCFDPQEAYLSGGAPPWALGPAAVKQALLAAVAEAVFANL